jgi:hypothetical protein
MMRVRTAAQIALVATVIFVALASAALASANRTFVSGSGSDGNTGANCSAGSPCRSFAAAYSVTSSGGEIIALDSAGYGEVTITGPVSIVGALIASVQVAANSTGITINAGPTDNIILRNLQINGGNAVNSIGIAVTNAHVTLQNSTLKLLQTGLSVSGGKVDLINTDILDNGTGIFTDGTGPDAFDSGGFNVFLTEVRLFRGNIIGNAVAWTMNNPGVTGQGSGQNNPTIWINGDGKSNAQFGSARSPNIFGNSTVAVITGNGSSCSNHNGSNVCLPAQSYFYDACALFGGGCVFNFK